MHHLIKAAVEQQILGPIPGRELKLQVSIYADDAMIFVNPTRQEVDNLITILLDFGSVTGLCINPAKSSVASINCEEVDI